MRILLASLALALLSGCGLSPMYAGGGSGMVAQSLAAIEVAPIEGRAGWLVRSALEERLGAAGQSAPPMPRCTTSYITPSYPCGRAHLPCSEPFGAERRAHNNVV